MTVVSHRSAVPAVLRFSTDIGPESVTAFISHSALRARYDKLHKDDDLRTVVSEHRAEIDAAILRRIEAGARQPIILRASDLCLSRSAGFAPLCCA